MIYAGLIDSRRSFNMVDVLFTELETGQFSHSGRSCKGRNSSNTCRSASWPNQTNRCRVARGGLIGRWGINCSCGDVVLVWVSSRTLEEPRRLNGAYNFCSGIAERPCLAEGFHDTCIATLRITATLLISLRL